MGTVKALLMDGRPRVIDVQWPPPPKLYVPVARELRVEWDSVPIDTAPHFEMREFLRFPDPSRTYRGGIYR